MSVQVNSLMSCVQRVKPFHTKILGVEISYVVVDPVNVSITERLDIDMHIGIPAGYYMPIGSAWDADSYDVSGYDGSRIKPSATNVPDQITWNGVSYNTEWDTLFQSIGGREYPNIDGVGSGMIDGMHVSLKESLHMDIRFSDVNTPKPLYVEVPDIWDGDNLSIIDHGPNWVDVPGNRIHTFTAQPLLIFQIIRGTLGGTYTCIDAISVTTGITRIYTAENILIAPGPGSLGTIDIGYWDDQGWDQTITAMLPSSPTTFPVGTNIFEMFSISEGVGWDQGEWDSTSGVYTGTTDQHYHHPDFWTIQDLWDDAINIVDGHNVYTPSAIPLNANANSGNVLAYTWDTSEFDLHGYNGNECIADGTNFGLLNAYTDLQGTHKRIMFGSSIGVTLGRMVEVHVQDVPSRVWAFSDPLQGIGSFIAYDESGTQVEWLTCSISAGHSVTIEFSAPIRGYVLGE